MKFDGFDWDQGHSEKCRKHGVSRAAIEALFVSDLHVAPDLVHSRSEQRFRAVGRTTEGRAIFLVFTLRRRGDDLLIRPISARYMHRKEIEAYEKDVS